MITVLISLRCAQMYGSYYYTIIPTPVQNSDTADHLPTFEEVCQLRCPTLQHIPAKFCPAFAHALPFSLQLVLEENSTEAWLKLCALPKSSTAPKSSRWVSSLQAFSCMPLTQKLAQKWSSPIGALRISIFFNSLIF